MKDIIRQIAINEVLYPTFELTKQYLQVNKILLNEGNPVIEDLIFSEDKDFAEVYFRIEDEDYFFVVIINLKPEPSLHFMNMSPGNYIYLIVSSETEDVDRLLKLVDIKPTQKWAKGEKYPRVDNYYDDSGFIYRPEEKTTGEVEDKIDRMLDFLLSKKDGFIELSRVAETTIEVVYHGYKDQMWGINLKKDTLKKISELNLSINIDLYASGPDLYED